MWEQFLEKKSSPVKNEIEKGAVRKFAEAIGDTNPLYLDEEFAIHSAHGRLLAPPTFPRTFEYGDIEGLEFPKAGMIHGEQYFHYNRPIYVGDVLYCQCALENVTVKQARSGELVFVTIKQWGLDEQQREVFSARRVSIITEAVRKEMGV